MYFQGEDWASKRRAGEALAGEVKASLLVVDLAKIVESKSNFDSILKLAFREAGFQNALLYLDGVDALLKDEQAISYQCLRSTLATAQGVTVLAGMQPWNPTSAEPLGILTVPFFIPDFDQRRYCWQTHLAAAGINLNEADLDALAARFRLTPNRIADAVVTTCNTARWQAAAGGQGSTENSSLNPIFQPKLADLFAAARMHSSHDLAELARKIKPNYSFDDIVLPADCLAQLQEICNHVKYRHLVHEEWGFESKLSLGKGLNVLFSGQSGTGKTMASEALARELQLDLYKIDLSQVVSKYIGETEKNLNRIFTAAANSNAILLFDEADALFGKRSEVKDARDRYANIEIGYLLQKMEEFEGLAILTTNLRNSIDDAFVRRLRFIVDFPFPNEKHRRQIWQQIWPKTVPCSPEIDLDFLARRFEIAGASIRNIALAAAFLAASEGEVINMTHLIRAIRREYQKTGKLLMDEDLGKFRELK